MKIRRVSAVESVEIDDEVSGIRRSAEPLGEEPVTGRTGKELIAATRSFAEEQRVKSWWHLSSSFAILLAAQAVVVRASWWWAQSAAVLLSALMLLRIFILYHDYMHHALLKRSWLARAIMHAFGYLILAPPRIWKRSHDYHHAHTAKMVGSQIGSFPTMSAAMYERLSSARRIAYQVARHPLTMLFGYFTVFIWGMCVGPFVTKPRENAQGMVSLLAYASFGLLVSWTLGVQAWLLAVVVPHFVAAALGSYLFYAQHNYPDVAIRSRHDWSYTDAALHAASYMKMGPVMQYFSGNIGYHHVHHLNPSIPFYNLPATMAAIPELQEPGETSLHPRDVVACLRLKLWDGDRQRMVG